MKINDQKNAARARELLAEGKLGAMIAGQAQLLGKLVSDPWCDAKQRAAAEKRLLKAYLALRPATWTPAVALYSIAMVLDFGARDLARGQEEAYVVERMQGQIAGIMDDFAAPEDWHGRRADPKLVADALGAWSRKRAPAGHDSKYACLARLLVALGLSGSEDAEAAKKMLDRLKARKRARAL